MKKPYMQIDLASIEIHNNGFLQESIDGVLNLTWRYPCPNEPMIQAALPLNDISNGYRKSFAGLSLCEKMLFKQAIAGKSVLKAEIAVTRDIGFVNALFKNLFAMGMERFNTFGLGAALSELKYETNQVRVIGSTVFEIDPQMTVMESKLRIPSLFRIYHESTLDDFGDEIQPDTDIETFKPGDVNGRMVLNLTLGEF